MQNKVICLKVIVFLFYKKNIIRENSAHIYFFFVKHIYNLSSKIHDVRCDNNTRLWTHVHTAILQNTDKGQINATIIFVLKIYIKTPLKLSK